MAISANPIHDRIDEALFRHLIGSSAIPLVGSGLAGVLMAAGLWREETWRLVSVWLALIFAVIALRVWLTARIRQQLGTCGYRRGEAFHHALTTGLSGIAWGVGGMFIPTAEPLAVALVVTAIQSLVMGGVVTLAAYVPAFLAFALPACLPMIVVLALSGQTTGLLMAVYSSLFLLLMLGIALSFNRSLRRTWQLTFEKEDLITALTEAHDRLAVLADTDGLTGLANRRRFDEMLARDVARLRRTGATLSLILLDVDHFKKFNDHYGHVAGDDCLRQLAGILPGLLHRATDLVARYGGEELAVLLPDTDHAGAVALAETIRATVAAQAIPHAASGTAAHVTVSLGVATVRGDRDHAPRDVIHLADEQLYRAKSDGRNRVVAVEG